MESASVRCCRSSKRCGNVATHSRGKQASQRAKAAMVGLGRALQFGPRFVRGFRAHRHIGRGLGRWRQSYWPIVTAQIEQCRLDDAADSSQETYLIAGCKIAFSHDGETPEATVYSRNRRTRQAGQLQDWIDAHHDGSSITARYDPGNPHKALLLTDHPVIWGPHTPENLRLFAVFALASALTFAVARVGRRLLSH
jgi:hypothetical protein